MTLSHFIKGITYSYNRNIGWQDRSIRTVAGTLALISGIYFLTQNNYYSILLFIFAAAQAWTVLSAKCIICYFTGKCTIDVKEQLVLKSKGVPFEK
jgi:hypothetical protein